MKINLFIAPLLIAALAIATSTTFSDELREELIEVKTKQADVTAGKYGTHYLSLNLRGHENVLLYLSEEEAKILRDLPGKKDYIFRIWFAEKPVLGIRDRLFPFAELTSVSDGNQVLIDRSRCHVHQIPMKRALAKIHYGLPSPELNDAYPSFSGGPGFVLGGCVVGPESPKEEFSYICKKCVEAYETWKKRNG